MKETAVWRVLEGDITPSPKENCKTLTNYEETHKLARFSHRQGFSILIWNKQKCKRTTEVNQSIDAFTSVVCESQEFEVLTKKARGL